MPEPFTAIGFHVNDQAAYEALAAEARLYGAMTQARRDQATLHGCCWELGGGLEVWMVLHESREGLCYADCRPAFRGRQSFELFPWEILEFEDEGEAVVRAHLDKCPTEIIFELQNLTEIGRIPQSSADRSHRRTRLSSALASTPPGALFQIGARQFGAPPGERKRLRHTRASSSLAHLAQSAYDE